jgi:hypothetical protein
MPESLPVAAANTAQRCLRVREPAQLLFRTHAASMDRLVVEAAAQITAVPAAAC